MGVYKYLEVDIDRLKTQFYFIKHLKVKILKNIIQNFLLSLNTFEPIEFRY